MLVENAGLNMQVRKMKKRLLFIINIHSGKEAVKFKLAKLLDGFVAAGYEVITHTTQYAGDAALRSEEYAEEVDMIVCSGGDGTLNSTLNGLMKSGHKVPVLFIPFGSTNDYAGSLNIPKDPMNAVERLEHGKILELDIGKFNDKYFDYVAAFGLLTDIAYTTDQNLKNMIGYGAYVVEVTKRLFKIPILQMTIEGDNGISFTDGWFYGMITNSNQVGGLKNITGPDVELDDGVFEVTLVRATRNPIEFIEVLTSIARGTECKFVERFKTKHLHITSKEPIAWTLDGEPGGEHTEINIEVLQKAIQIVVPDETKKTSSN